MAGTCGRSTWIKAPSTKYLPNFQTIRPNTKLTMKTTLKIAKTELALLFYSPIAWFLLVAFLFQCGLAYTGVIEGLLTQQELGGAGLRYLTFLTAGIFAPPYGIWPSLAGKLYLYLPLLTMGLMSRETSSGT